MGDDANKSTPCRTDGKGPAKRRHCAAFQNDDNDEDDEDGNDDEDEGKDTDGDHLEIKEDGHEEVETDDEDEFQIELGDLMGELDAAVDGLATNGDGYGDDGDGDRDGGSGRCVDDIACISCESEDAPVSLGDEDAAALQHHHQ